MGHQIAPSPLQDSIYLLTASASQPFLRFQNLNAPRCSDSLLLYSVTITNLKNKKYACSAQKDLWKPFSLSKYVVNQTQTAIHFNPDPGKISRRQICFVLKSIVEGQITHKQQNFCKMYRTEHSNAVGQFRLGYQAPTLTKNIQCC